MEHLAIMRKSWGLLPKVLTGEKVIESRWYKNKYAPWDRIKEGDIVYFKNSGEQVSVKSEVASIMQFHNLTPKKVKEILDLYGVKDGIAQDEVEKYYQMFKNKNYCLLVFLKNPQKIIPFEISKKGFGAMSAWIAVENINMLRV